MGMAHEDTRGKNSSDCVTTNEVTLVIGYPAFGLSDAGLPEMRLVTGAEGPIEEVAK
jgi:hypothetical protein